MRLKPRLTTLLAYIFIIGVAVFSSLTRKAVAMDRVSEPVVTHMLLKQQDISSKDKFVRVAITANEKIRVNITPIETPEIGSAPISASSPPTQDLAGVGSSSGAMTTRRPAALQHAGSSASSISPKPSPKFNRTMQPHVLGSPPPPTPPRNATLETSAQSEFRSGSVNNRLLQSTKKFKRGLIDCCGAFAGNKGSYFNNVEARGKRENWNEMLKDAIDDEHKPKTLLQNLSCHDNKIFSSSDTEENPLYVFAHADSARVLAHVADLRDREGSSSSGSQYEPDQIIFEVSIPAGTYIKAFTFIDKYTEKTDSAKDDRGHKLLYSGLKDKENKLLTEGLVNPDKAPEHLSTGSVKSSTHADLYVRRGKKATNWACVGAISNHTGTAREPKKANKLNRIATYRQ